MSNEKKQSLSLYKLLNHNKSEAEELEFQKATAPDAPRNFFLFFVILKRRIYNLIHVNLLILICNFPIFFLLLAVGGNFSDVATTPQSPLFPNTYGALQLAESTPYSAVMLGIFGTQSTVYVNNTTTYILYAIGALVLITFGLVNCGVAYVTRNMTKGESVSVTSEFFSAIKTNWRQGIILGIFDVAFMAITLHNILFFSVGAVTGGFTADMFFFVMLFITFFYLFARMYLYPIAVTFNLSVYKIIKNSFIFSLVGLKRNIVALVAILLILILNYTVFVAFAPLGFILPMFFTLGVIYFIMTYAVWPNIDKIMIKPYYNADGTPKEGTFEE